MNVLASKIKFKLLIFRILKYLKSFGTYSEPTLAIELKSEDMETNLEQMCYNCLEDLMDILWQLRPEDYSAGLAILGDKSIGQHYRHSIEIFQELIQGYERGSINYDLRKRSTCLEQHRDLAVEILSMLQCSFFKKNKSLILESGLCDQISTLTSYDRELLYNLEHIIHHQAIITPALRSLGYIRIPEHFGIAPSTVKYQEELCAH